MWDAVQLSEARTGPAGLQQLHSYGHQQRSQLLLPTSTTAHTAPPPLVQMSPLLHHSPQLPRSPVQMLTRCTCRPARVSQVRTVLSVPPEISTAWESSSASRFHTHPSCPGSRSASLPVSTSHCFTCAEVQRCKGRRAARTNAPCKKGGLHILQ